MKRNVTFREPPLADVFGGDGPCNDRTPLLNRQSSTVASHDSRLRIFADAAKDVGKQAWSFATSKTGQGVLKCSLAYLLGSLATFVPPIAAFLGQQDGKHLVATVTVYFHPARSQGSMYKAIILAFAAFIYAVFISFASMGVSVLFHARLGLIVIGHAVVLIVFCGCGLGFVGWAKQRLGNPLVNVACSLTSLAIITILTKEGAVQAGLFSIDKVVQVMKMILLGCLATTAVCFLIRPVSARRELKINIIQVTDSFADMLAVITGSFLSGSDEQLQQIDRHSSVYASLAKNLKEAKYEHYGMGTEREYAIEARLLNCLQRLAQGIGGLRSAASTQFDLIAQSTTGGATTPIFAHCYPHSLNASASSSPLFATSPQDDHRILPTIDEVPAEPGNIEHRSNSVGESSAEDASSAPTLTLPAEIFTRFITQLGPPLKSLAYTLKHILDELPYGPSPAFEIAVNSNFRSSLTQAIELYKRAKGEALFSIYRNKDLNKTRPREVEADFEEVAASCGHFSFCLEDLAEDMKVYLDILDDLKLEVDERPMGRSWSWLKFWRKSPSAQGRGTQHDPEQLNMVSQEDETGSPNERLTPIERAGTSVFDSERLPQQPTFSYRLWKALRLFRRDDIKFAIKVGAGAALYALPSFLTATRPFYQHWRGEWGLLSYMLVCSMTIGAANTTGYSRFLGTCIGAVCAVGSWTASQGNAYALAALGWLMSLWTSYIIVAKGNGPMGRFIILTYNLSALYAYSLSVRDEEGDDDDDEGGFNPIISEIVLHRVVAVLSGCLWGLIVTKFISPISARKKFKDGLSLLWLRMGLIWKRDPLFTLIVGESSIPYMNLKEEFELQRFLSRLDNLRKAASSEFELRGPFPDAAYERILKSTGRMLDAFHAMNVVMMKDPKASEGEAEMLVYTARERAHLCARISHLFQGRRDP